jgi:HPt (histidine-containing phosphotransfer) domain-containing protein
VLFRTILRVTKRSAPVVAAAPDAPRSVSGVDIATALARMGGDAQLLDRQLRRLVRATESDVARARRLCDDGDLAGAAEPMHRIVGAASTLGCDDLAAAAHDAEQRLLGDGWLDATVFQRVERHLSVLARALAPDPVPQAERTVDHLAVQRLCTALRDALRAQTLEAEPLLDQLDELLDPPTRHALQVVRAHVEELEYPAALSHLDQLRLGGVS